MQVVAPSRGKAKLGSVGQESVGERGRGLRGVRGFIETYFGILCLGFRVSYVNIYKENQLDAV